MSILSTLGNFFKGLGETIVHGLGYASTHGLTDAIVEAAKKYAKDALTLAIDNTGKREMVVAKLISEFGIPESIARLAVELAVQALKAELPKL